MNSRVIHDKVKVTKRNRNWNAVLFKQISEKTLGSTKVSIRVQRKVIYITKYAHHLDQSDRWSVIDLCIQKIANKNN